MSSPRSMPDPRGQILGISRLLDGTSQVKVDNGPFRTITIHCLTEQLGDLASSDMLAIRAHLMSRERTHFRRKTAANRKD
jgi:hypothetical protein